MPNFLIIGASKAGSSSLYHYTRQHPEVFMSSVKEPNFFDIEGETLDFQGPDRGVNETSVTTLEKYQALFEGADGYKAVGEASCYLHATKAPERIRHYVPAVRIIAVLRHPADRAFSSYSHLVRDGHEPLSFERGLEEESNRLAAKWSNLFAYVGQGFYYGQLKRFFDLFPRDQFRIYLYEELSSDTAGIVSDVFEFLGVDPGFKPDLTRMNVSGIPKSRTLYDLFTKKNPVKSMMKPFFPRSLRHRVQNAVGRANLGPKPSYDPETRRKLTEVFREDILKLQDLIQKDLSHWLAEGKPGSRGADERNGSLPRTAV